MDENSILTYNKCKNLDFNIGDRFHEMYSVWICIIHITKDDKIVTLEGHPSRPLSMEVKKQSREELFKRLSYGSIEACWVSYSDTLPVKTASWLEHYKSEMLATNSKDVKRDLDLTLMLNELS